METQDVAELWANRMEVDNYNMMMMQQQQNQRNNNYTNSPRPKTASRNYEPPGRDSSDNNNRNSGRAHMWYLDLFNNISSSTLNIARGSQ